jgi:hypothetical protein
MASVLLSWAVVHTVCVAGAGQSQQTGAVMQ